MQEIEISQWLFKLPACLQDGTANLAHLAAICCPVQRELKLDGAIGDFADPL